MIRWKELWESDIGFIIRWNMTWNIQLDAKKEGYDVKIANSWRTYGKGAKMLKVGFMLHTHAGMLLRV